jgi:hypothetical protein
MLESPNYYAILPAVVRYDERLKPMEKIIYAEITALANIKGYCYASNSYFAELYEVNKKTVSSWINNLIKYGYLKSKLIKEDKKVKERRLYICNSICTYPLKDGEGYPQKNGYPIHKKMEDNITRFNTTSINNIYTFWNKQKIIEHRKLTDKMKRKINTILKDYEEKDIKESIKNYAEILKGEEYFFTYRWTLIEFLDRGLERFMNGEVARRNYLKRDGGGPDGNGPTGGNSSKDIKFDKSKFLYNGD